MTEEDEGRSQAPAISQFTRAALTARETVLANQAKMHSDLVTGIQAHQRLLGGADQLKTMLDAAMLSQIRPIVENPAQGWFAEIQKTLAGIADSMWKANDWQKDIFPTIAPPRFKVTDCAFRLPPPPYDPVAARVEDLADEVHALRQDLAREREANQELRLRVTKIDHRTERLYDLPPDDSGPDLEGQH